MTAGLGRVRRGEFRGARRTQSLLVYAFLAALTYVPLLFTASGRVAADTRQDMFIDPGRFMSHVFSMWDPSRHLGAVTHQNIGLAFPMGSFFWLTDTLGLPVWLAQRLWLGSILFLAGAGVLYLARTLRWQGPGPVIAAVVFAMSPYVLQYAPHTSVLLLPWAGLPWLVGLAARSVETKGWRHPALFALVTMVVGSVNASALFFVLLGPALYFVVAAWVTHDASWREVLRAAGRIGALVLVTSAWWVMALRVESVYGLPLLSFTETLEQVATTSSATEVLRGLGYWVFYTRGRLYLETAGSADFLSAAATLIVTFIVPLLAFLAAAVTRWRHRALSILFVVVGVVIGVGAFPIGEESPLGSLFRDFANGSSLGLAFRSSTRAAPLVVLGVAMLVGALVAAVIVRARRVGLALGAVVAALAIASGPAYATGFLVDPHFDRPEHLPAYWRAAGKYVDAHADGSRVLEVPGVPFATYRWGTTYEPISPLLFETPVAAREQIPFGSAGTADLMNAFDRRIQEGVLEPSVIAPVARLLAAGQVLVRSDLEFERFDISGPDEVWRSFEGPPAGLGRATDFGTSDPPKVAVFPVDDAVLLVRAVPVRDTTILDGDGEGIVDAAAAGLVDGQGAVLYAATSVRDQKALERALDAGAPIVVTDSNRRRARRWRSLRNVDGTTLRADEDPADQTSRGGGEAPLEVFPGAGSEWQTVNVQQHAKVSATSYGGHIQFDNGLRPAAAFDGDPTTAWVVIAPFDEDGDRLTIDLDQPVKADRLQLLAGNEETVLTKAVAVRLDDGPPIAVTLGPTARAGLGQTITFPATTFSRVEIELTAKPDLPEEFRGLSSEPMSIAEVTIPGAEPVDELLRLPIALVDEVKAESLDRSLSYVFTRLRANPSETDRVDEERSIKRIFRVPSARSFTLSGDVGGSTVALDSTACRSDLLSVDGQPLPVRVHTTTDARLTLEGCAPLVLGAGDHIVRTAPGQDGGLHLDRLVLASAAGGAGAPAGPDGRPVAAPARAHPRTRVLEARDTSDRARVAATSAPYWLILAESWNEGWEATANGTSLGTPTLINGYANGWYVDPDDAATTISMDWTPQRSVDLALWLSLLGVVGCGVLIARGRRWSAEDGDTAVAFAGPKLGLTDETQGASWTSAIVAGVGYGVFAGVVTTPIAGPVVGVVVALAARFPRLQVFLAGGGCIAAGGAFAVVIRERFSRQEEPAFDVFTGLHGAHWLALAGVVLLGAALIASVMGRGNGPGTP